MRRTPDADANETHLHILRRLTFGPTATQLADVASLAHDELIDQLLAAAPLSATSPDLGSDDDYGRVTQWWFDLLRDPGAGLHERMVWFWHGHLTSSLDKAAPGLMIRQNQLLRANALGNFRELLQAITIDAAMLYWLDGAYSTAENPNENYGRELMELFALGRDAGYTEDDVHNAAIALAGWWVDGEDGDSVKFDDEQRGRTVTFLGRRVASAAEVVDAVCDHPACAPYIAGKLYWYFHGVDPDPDVRAELAAVFSDSGLEIRPLLEATVRHPTFLTNRLNRPRTPLEWYVALCRLYERQDNDWWPLEGLGHVPFGPPNVAGWPTHDRWLSVGAELNKAQTAYDLVWEVDPPATDDPVSEYVARTALSFSDETLAVLRDAYDDSPDAWEPYHALLAVITLSPEFNVT